MDEYPPKNFSTTIPKDPHLEELRKEQERQTTDLHLEYQRPTDPYLEEQRRYKEIRKKLSDAYAPTPRAATERPWHHRVGKALIAAGRALLQD